ncbi:uncharacterized protein [Venturia canescens]|uniref:uncharacterized protein n=1 Tax=Venturia canescens TaxID=32260 RepID=UPI001C9C0392|nr:uncharacterized protein LOC122409165 [Venturia canescens]
MSSYSPTLALTAVFVLTNFVLVSTQYSCVEINRNYNLTEADLARLTASSTTAKFNGDLTVGNRLSNDSLWTLQMTVTNPSSSVISSSCHWGFPPSIKINWMSIINEPGSDAVFCDAAGNLGDRLIAFSVRVNPNSTALFNLYVATYSLPQHPFPFNNAA